MNELEPLKPYIEDILTTLGKHVGKRLLKVLTHFGTGIVKYPKRMIERMDAEATAKSEARIAIIEAATENVTGNPDLDPEFVKQVLVQSIGWTFEDVANFNKIVGDTTESLLNNPPQEDVNADQSTEDISKDWLNEFRGIACKKSSEDAQNLFSKVLAGEIRKPGSFSLRALTTLSDMDQNVAMIFKAFCSLCLVNLDNPRMYHFTQSKSNFKIKDARIPFLSGSIEDISFIRTIDHIGDNDVSRFVNMSKSIYNSFGLRLSEFQLLSEYGLIDNSSHIEYNHFWYNNELWDFLQPDVNFSQSSEDYQNITISGYALTSVGKELFHITKRHAHPQYWKLLTDYLQKFYNITLYKTPKPQKKSSPDGSADQNTAIPDNS